MTTGYKCTLHGQTNEHINLTPTAADSDILVHALLNLTSIELTAANYNVVIYQEQLSPNAYIFLASKG